MIVKCEQCQTRFKIPDDKVTDKGVKVRCTRCSHTFRVTRDMAEPATVPSVAPPAAAPFARFGAAPGPQDTEVTMPGVFALGVEATRHPAPLPSHPARPPTSTENSRPFDFGSLTPPGATSPASAAVPASSPSPFDFAAMTRPAAASAAPSGAFDFSNFAVPTQPVAPLPSVRAGPPRAPAPALPAFDFAQMAPPLASGNGAFELPGLQSQSSAPMEMAASTDARASSLEIDGASARVMFELPPPAASSLLDLPPEEASPSRRQVEQVSLSRGADPRVVVPAPPAGEKSRRRRLVGVVVNVAIAAVLVLGLVVVGSAALNEGEFTTEALSLEGLKNTFAPSVDFVANDVSNGLYETRAGRSVFFVRGEVMNRSEASVKVVVKAEIVEGGKVVRFGESWAGEPASPEELFLIDTRESLEVLNGKVEKRSLVVPAGAAAAFVVPFTEYPPDLKGFRVRVSARAVPANPTAGNP